MGAGAWNALRYTATGWDFELLHTMDGEPAEVDATAVYHFCDGDFRDLWREYRALPEVDADDGLRQPAVGEEGCGGRVLAREPGGCTGGAQGLAGAGGRLGGGSLPLGVFAWSLDGDYETRYPFLNEGMSLITTPEWFGGRIASSKRHRA